MSYSIRLVFFLLLTLPLRLSSAGSVPFMENKGQWEQDFSYYLKLKTAQVYFFNNRILIDTWHQDDYQSALEKAHHRKAVTGRDGLRRHAYEIAFVNAQPMAGVNGELASAQLFNFYLGNNPLHWKTGLHAFEQIRYGQLWEGIDLIYKIYNGHLKYDFQVAPGKDPAKIRMRYSGVNNLTITDGRLIIEKTCGNVVELAPLAWQSDGKHKHPVKCAYKLENQELSFQLGAEYNPNLPLTIDPEIIFSTYSGSTGDNWAATATYDEEGNAYMGGINFAPGYPVTTGAYQTAYVGNVDVTISKFSPSGDKAIYSTYLGGSLTEIPYSMIVDSQGNLVVTGSTGSSNFPVTAGAADASFGGGSQASFWQTGPSTYLANYPNGSDFFVSKFSPMGNSLIGSTYLGGSSNDGLNLSSSLNHNYGDIFRGEVITDQQNNIYVIGSTRSTNLPVKNAWQQNYGGGTQDACFFKLNPQVSNILCCSYFGGSGDDSGYGMAMDGNGSLYFCGGSSSVSLSGNAGLNQLSNGGVEGYVALVNASGGNNVRYTYLGSSGYDQCYFVQVDNAGNVVVLGQTDGNYPVRQEGSSPLYSVPGGTIFFHKLNNQLNQSRWSTRFGTSGQANHLVPTAFLVDYCNYISFSIWGGEVNAPLYSTTVGLSASTDAFQPSTSGSDFYLGVLKDNASALHYGTFFGGFEANEHVDGGTSRFDKKGIIYQSICAGCGPEADDMPVTPGVWSVTNNSSNCNAAVFKFDLSEYSAIIEELRQEAKCVGKQIAFRSLSTGNPQLTWQFGDGSTSGLKNPIHTYQDTGTYLVRLIAAAQSSCILSDTAEIEVKIERIPQLKVGATPPVCKGDTLQLEVSGAPRLTWLLAPGLRPDQLTLENPEVVPPASTTYRVIGESNCGTDTAFIPVEVISFVVTLSTEDSLLCLGDTALINVSEAEGIKWTPAPFRLENTGINAYYLPASSVYISVEATDDKGCRDTDSLSIEVLLYPEKPELKDTLICDGISLQLSGPNGTNDAWYEGPIYLGNGPITVTPGKSTTYFLLAQNQCGSVSDTMNVTVNRIEATVGPSSVVCAFDTLEVFAEGGTYYKWTPPEDFSHPDSAVTLLIPKSGRIYSVMVSDENGCADSDTLLLNTYKAGFVNAGPDQFIAFGEPLKLFGIADPGRVKWISDRWLSCDTCLQTNSYTDTTAFYVLKLVDKNGCEYADTMKVQLEGSLYLPNTFTPNEDGINETFGALSIDVTKFRLEIFNRWGELLFTSLEAGTGWDGRYKGQVVQTDVYIYKLRYTLNSGREERKRGWVLLVK